VKIIPPTTEEQTPAPSKDSIAAFRRTVKAFFRKNRRPMPWRETADPYHIVVSEIMLQQTQVERVWDKYLAFVRRFPDFQALASARLQEVLALWQGLGYNRRAIALKKISETVIAAHGGALPASVETLTTLPGIGHATASSIAAFAFNLPSVFIETNIRRVFIHHFFDDRTDVHDNEILPLVEATLDRKHPREWYYALMDYGTALKKELPNPNRRSKHYTKQSKFEGSTRQKRGAILRFVLAHPNSTIHAIAKHLSLAPADILPTTGRLVTEGFLQLTKKRYHVV
jgi:A/G-specific adenine glycosylase